MTNESPYDKMMREAREAPVEIDTEPVEIGSLATFSPDRDALLKKAYLLQEEITDMKKVLKYKEKTLGELHQNIVEIGIENDPASDFMLIQKTRRGNQFIVPSRFKARFPEILDSHFDDLITIHLTAAKQFIQDEKNLLPVIERKPDSTSYAVEYIPKTRH